MSDRILRLQHVQVRVPDLELCTAYYTEVLGLIETAHEENRVFLKCWDEHEHHSVVLRQAPTYGLDHMSFKVAELDDLDHYTERVEAAGIPVKEVAAHTGFPEIMDGRVKTLHPKIHGGLLARRDLADHVAAQKTHDIPDIDLLVVNLYPFQATVAAGKGWEDCIENIDIGGPAMLRAAAKNHDFVTIVVDPADYDLLLAELAANNNASSLAFRRKLAQKAYAHTAQYDGAIANWMAAQAGAAASPAWCRAICPRRRGPIRTPSASTTCTARRASRPRSTCSFTAASTAPTTPAPAGPTSAPAAAFPPTSVSRWLSTPTIPTARS